MSLIYPAEWNPLPADLAEPLVRICRLVEEAGGQVWLVGGSVRDLAMQRQLEDLDLEVFGLPAEDLQACLAKSFELDLVGVSFGILKLRGLPIDVGLPRSETKSGHGHRGFAISADPELPLERAAARRDFTVNAIYWNPLTGEIKDPWGGLDDLKRGILRHTSAAFSEDPLRVMRAMQFAARFELRVAPVTVELCRQMELEGLAGERIWQEWVKLINLGAKPSLGLNFLHECGWLTHFPELDALRGCEQDAIYHPEGDVWVHTLHCMDAFAGERTGDQWEDLVVGCAVLCHDLGKPATTKIAENGRISSRGHEDISVTATTAFLGRLTDNQKLMADVLPLVQEHMRPNQLFYSDASSSAIRRLADRVGRIDRLVRVARADMFGRPPLPTGDYPAGDWLRAKAEELAVFKEAEKPLILGRHLIALGAEPGPKFSEILREIYQAQLAGEFSSQSEGEVFAVKLMSKK
ncbi:MAG: tRNA nucleotidyltransferase (CCA-adding enzyme) [Candidatus Krumholzibacteriia bacterium]